MVKEKEEKEKKRIFQEWDHPIMIPNTKEKEKSTHTKEVVFTAVTCKILSGKVK